MAQRCACTVQLWLFLIGLVTSFGACNGSYLVGVENGSVRSDLSPSNSLDIRILDSAIPDKMPLDPSPCQVIATEPLDTCNGTSDSMEIKGRHVGWRIDAYDADQNVLLDSSVYRAFDGKALPGNEPAGSAGSYSDTHCLYNTKSTTLSVQASATQYAPRVCHIKLIPGQVVVVKAPLKKSCTSGISCFDNYHYLNSISTDFYTASEARQAFDKILAPFVDLAKATYTCAECTLRRGGWVKAQGHVNQSPFKLSFDEGYCSAAGTDCGFGLCFSSPDQTLFSSVKQKLCTALPAEFSGKCISGEYDYASSTEQAISLYWSENTTTNSVVKLPANCIDVF